jgi:formylglycine-generating enzyme required for sulfatase activity
MGWPATGASRLVPPNEFGLYDMVGNVFEWTEDCGHANYDGAPTDSSAWTAGDFCDNRVLRGGSWVSPPDGLRSATRGGNTTGTRNYIDGFRVARTLLAP